MNPQSRSPLTSMGSPGEPGLGYVFQMWNNSKSPITYMWGKISDCHIIEVEPCTGTIGTTGTAGRVMTCPELAGEGDLRVTGRRAGVALSWNRLQLQPDAHG